MILTCKTCTANSVTPSFKVKTVVAYIPRASKLDRGLRNVVINLPFLYIWLKPDLVFQKYSVSPKLPAAPEGNVEGHQNFP